MTIAFVGMETSGAIRRALQAKNIETYSCDLLPSEDGGEEMTYSPNGLPLGRHMQGDIFLDLENMTANDLWPEIAVFHPDCTYLTNSAAWAYKDGPYHQKVKPKTLTGAARRAARHESLDMVRRIMALPIKLKIIENPIGAINTAIRKPTQILHPNQVGDDASKATCLWILDENGNDLPQIDLSVYPKHPGRQVTHKGKLVTRWANQTDSGQNRLTPGEHRWKDRARTYPGIAMAISDYAAAFIERLYQK